MKLPRWPAAHPNRTGIMLLTAFLGSVTVPALHSWNQVQKGRLLARQRARFEEIHGTLRKPEQHRVPERWRRENDPASWAWMVPAAGGAVFDHEQLFPAQDFERFQQKTSAEGELARILDAPELLRPAVTRDAVELRWNPPQGLAELRGRLGDNPLLELGFRVYRWRDGEEPRLLASTDVTQTFYRDLDLPLWRQRFSYCVFTVLEGRIGQLPTLIESKRSQVIAAETLESFSLEVLDGTDREAVVQVSAYHDGAWIPHTFRVAVGERVAALVEVDGDPASVDTGLTLEALEVTASSQDLAVERAEFLPDGRRRVDPETNAPTFARFTSSVPVQTVTLRCRDTASALRTFTSRPLR